MERRLDLKVGFRCNNNCIFCAQSHKRNLGNRTTEELKERLKKGREDGYNELVFTGGEPTIRKDILELVRFAKDLGYELIQIQTNGRMLSYKDFARKLIDAGVTEVSPALHGHDKKMHESHTRCSDSFEQTLQGIKNLVELGCPVLTNSVITKINYKNLPELVELLTGLNVDQFQLAFVHPVGNAYKYFDKVVPKMTEVKPYIIKAMETGKKRGYGPGMSMVEAFPPCLMEGYENFCSELYMPVHSGVMDLDHDIEDFEKWRKESGKRKFPQCKGCRYDSICEGPWKEYPERFGSVEFISVNTKQYEKFWDEKVIKEGHIKAAINSTHIFEEDKSFLDMVEEKNARVLDCGCGYGRLMKYFNNIWGLDCSMEMLKKNPYYPERVIHHDLTEKFPFPDKSFDYSFASLVLMHLKMEDAIKVILEMKRVTKKKIAFNVASLKDYDASKNILFEQMDENNVTSQRDYTLRGVKKILSDAGLEKLSEINRFVRGLWHATIYL